MNNPAVKYRNAWGENKTLELTPVHLKCLRYHAQEESGSDPEFVQGGVYAFLTVAGLMRWNTPNKKPVLTEKGIDVLDAIKRSYTDAAMKMITVINSENGCKIAHASFEREDNKQVVIAVLHGDMVAYWQLMGSLSRGNAIHAETLIEQHILEWEML